MDAVEEKVAAIKTEHAESVGDIKNIIEKKAIFFPTTCTLGN